MISRPKRPGFS